MDFKEDRIATVLAAGVGSREVKLKLMYVVEGVGAVGLAVVTKMSLPTSKVLLLVQ